MASGAMGATESASQGGSPLASAADERIRTLIRAELDRQYAFKVARRTLELLVEAAIEPTEEGPGYRIVDRTGQTRYHQGSEPGSRKGAAPMTLGDLVDELRERYPDLFGKPPEPEPVLIPQDSEPDHDTMAEVRAAGARFVEQQTALAKSLATNSAERGRALADRVTGRFEGWRMQLGEHRKTPDAPASVESGLASPAVPNDVSQAMASPDAPTRFSRLRETAERFGEGMRGGLESLTDHVRSGKDATSGRGLVLGGVGTLIVLVGLIAFLALRGDSTSPPAEPQVAESGKTGPQGSTSPPQTSEPETKPTTDPVAEDPGEDPAQNPNALKGVPEVIDTATLKVAGKVVRLFGVEWVRGGQGQDLTRYLSGRSVACLPAAGSTAYTCTVEGRDLSEVVLFNGGGRASSEAAPEHVAAEEHARSEHLGVWKR